MALNHDLLLPSTFQHYLLGLFAVANNCPAIEPFLTLSEGLPNRQVGTPEKPRSTAAQLVSAIKTR